MTETRWTPRATVAAIIEEAGSFLLVEEHDAGQPVFNQPAGHLEEGESLIEAVQRETREETSLHFTPGYLVGIYRWQRDADSPCFLRFCFGGQIHRDADARPLDSAIVATHWKPYAELAGLPLRSPLVMRCIDDYLAGRRYHLDLLRDIPGAD